MNFANNVQKNKIDQMQRWEAKKGKTNIEGEIGMQAAHKSLRAESEAWHVWPAGLRLRNPRLNNDAWLCLRDCGSLPQM